MGLFDAIAGQVTGAASSGTPGAAPSGMLEAVMGVLNNPQTGGLQGLVRSFESQGLGGVIGSWIGTGQNLPISAEQLQQVLGNEQIQAIAQKLGISPQEISSQLAGLLPKVIDTATPGGTLPAGNGIEQAMGALGQLFK